MWRLAGRMGHGANPMTGRAGQSVGRVSGVKSSFSVDTESSIAVYVQIENQVQFAIASGKYGPGENLPSVRDMAKMLKINANTVTKAYRDLELFGIVHARRGVGVTVSDKAVELCKEDVAEMVRRHIGDAVAEALASGHSQRAIRKMVTEAITSGNLPYARN